MKNDRSRVLLALGSLYVIWGSTFLAIRIALQGYPPLLFAGLFGRWPSQGEWVGLAVGLAGVTLLQTGGDLRASPAGAAVLTVSCASWALGSIWSRRLPLPKGLMASGAQMLAGGMVLLLFAVLHGERIPAVPT